MAKKGKGKRPADFEEPPAAAAVPEDDGTASDLASMLMGGLGDVSRGEHTTSSLSPLSSPPMLHFLAWHIFSSNIGMGVNSVCSHPCRDNPDIYG